LSIPQLERYSGGTEVWIEDRMIGHYEQDENGISWSSRDPEDTSHHGTSETEAGAVAEIWSPYAQE
jgi:hypothetical protein